MREFTATGINPIVQSAVPLLVLAGRLRGQIANADVESLRRQCVEELRSFDDRARQSGVPSEDAQAARYVLCGVLDEAVLNTPWGAQSGWANQPLEVTIYGTRNCGERVFDLINRLLADPQRYLALLELCYISLALGFEGRFRLDERGPARLAEIRQDLYQRIARAHGPAETELSPRWKGVEDRRNAVMRFVPLWVVAAACAVLLAGAYIFFDSRLSDRTSPVNAALAGVGLESLDATPAQLQAPPSGFRQLLAPQIAQGTVQVLEQGAITRITITVPDLFASGSARVNARYEGLVHAVGSAANRVPGRVTVVGHTDDQPVRSFQFHDNFELSRARAQYVATLLKQDIVDAGRIDSAGKGDSEPLYKPPSAPENRARNRRVEIIHHRDG